MLSRTALAAFFLLAALLQATPAPSEPPVYVQAAVFWETQAERDAILTAFPALDIMKVKPGFCFIVVTGARELAEIQDRGFRTEVMVEDMERSAASRRKGNNFGDLYTYSEATALLDSLHAEHPDITTAKVSLGLSHQDRDIWAIKISDNPGVEEDEPEVLFDGLHHAREPITANVLCDFIKFLCDGYGTDPVATFLVNEREIWIVPVVNPDGYWYNESTYPSGGGMWRKNMRINEFTTCLGVDLNRNYPYMWGQGGSSTDPCDITYMGPYAGSEPECQAIMNLMNDHEFVTYNSYHSVAGMVLFAWGYTLTHTPDDALLRSMAQRMAAPGGYAYGQPGEILYLCSGGAFDWAYGQQTSKPKVYAFTTEVSGSDFWPQDSEVAGLVAENLPANLYLTEAAGAFIDLAEIEITDYAKGNGQVDPGESADLYATLENIGITESMSGVTAILRSCDPYVQMIDAASDYGAFQPLESKQNAYDPFGIAVAPGCPAGHGTTVWFDIFAEGGFHIRIPHAFVIGTQETVFSDDFESGTGHWTFAGGAWGLVTSTSVSPTHSITDSPTGNYANGVNTRMALATGLDLSDYSDATLSFMTRYATEPGYDYCYVETSIDGGAWTQVGARMSGSQTTWVAETRPLTAGCGHSNVKFRFRLEADTYVTDDGWYIDDVAVRAVGTPNTAPSEPALALPAEGAVVRSDHPVLTVVNSTDPDPGTTLTYGFAVYGDSLLTDLVTTVSGVTESADSTSWTVDVALADGPYWWRAWADDGTELGLCPEAGTFTVEAPTEAAESHEVPGSAWIAAEPNPFPGRTMVAFSLPMAGRAELSVYDVNGRLVASLVDASLERGVHRVAWDGRDEAGRAVGAGVYFCRIQAGDWRASLKLMVVR
jgi:carboxypeptidase T